LHKAGFWQVRFAQPAQGLNMELFADNLGDMLLLFIGQPMYAMHMLHCAEVVY
jgi:hypothetical protein